MTRYLLDICYIWAILCLGLPYETVADSIPLEISPYFRNSTLIQRDVPCKVWGRVTPGEIVSVRFGSGGVVASQPADENGFWEVILPPMKASAKANQYLVATHADEVVRVPNIIIGDVWLCAGQSNMAAMLPESYDWKAFCDDGVSWVRSMVVDLAHSSVPVKYDMVMLSCHSMATTQATIPAVPYYFARSLVKNGVDVPIGLLTVACSGKGIECFLSPKMLSFDESLSNKVAHTVGNGDVRGFEHWNAMFEPLRNVAIKGVLWYQGEANCGLLTTEEYQQYLEIFINGLRNVWGECLPFYMVQLSSFGDWRDVPEGESGRRDIRQAELNVASSVPNVGLASAVDLYATDAHPKAKVLIGDRLARFALNEIYGRDIRTVSGPIVSRATYLRNQCRVEFRRDTLGLGLALGYKNWSDNDSPISCDAIGLETNVVGFALSSNGSTWHYAEGYVALDNSVVLSNKYVNSPRYVHYAVQDCLVGWNRKTNTNVAGGINLYCITEDGVLLPASPFDTIKATPAIAGYPKEKDSSWLDNCQSVEWVGLAYDKVLVDGYVYNTIQEAVSSNPGGFSDIILQRKGLTIASFAGIDAVPIIGGILFSNSDDDENESPIVWLTIKNAHYGLTYGISCAETLPYFKEPDSWHTAGSSGELCLSSDFASNGRSRFFRIVVK